MHTRGSLGLLKNIHSLTHGDRGTFKRPITQSTQFGLCVCERTPNTSDRMGQGFSFFGQVEQYSYYSPVFPFCSRSEWMVIDPYGWTSWVRVWSLFGAWFVWLVLRANVAIVWLAWPTTCGRREYASNLLAIYTFNYKSKYTIHARIDSLGSYSRREMRTKLGRFCGF